jgi:(1->4)-alpha-D-glucan 1-alpha-D-glucosylmutase
MHESRTPVLRATYRVQLHAGFTLRDANAIVPYLDELGTSHMYASPIFAARKGSRHGYDVVDPTRVNPELGTETDLRALADSLHRRGMGLLVDIVPNHMSASRENPYWEDVLANGEQSPYAKWFDIEWAMHDDHRLVLPILSDDLDAVLSRGELRVEVTEAGARLAHFDVSVPLSPNTLPASLQLAQLDPAAQREATALYSGSGAADRLRALLDGQHYRLVGWRGGAREINYRRFFDVNDLVALRAEDPAVHEATHVLILRLIEEGVIDGLRVDHIDGLRDPAAYLRRLRAEVEARRAGGVPIVVEKILMEGERLRDEWPVDGTTGYERLNDIEDLFIDESGFAKIEQAYRSMRRSPSLTFAGTARAAKRAVLDRAFSADVTRLARLLEKILRARGGPQTREQVYHGIEELIADFPVYRSYVTVPGALHPDDGRALEVTAAKSRANDVTVASLICSIVAGVDRPPECQKATTELIDRIQQLTGAAMAKGVEDTAHYAYVALVSRNEVGGAPDRPLATALDNFHAVNRHYALTRPRSLIATATHDTKRSGDVRARISALSEIPDEWQRSVMRWRRLTRRHHQTIRGHMVPDANAERFLYQTLVGIWPAPRSSRRADDVPDKQWRTVALDRLTRYMLKAVREAKLRTSWTDPDPAYEKALMDFIAAVMQAPEDDPFLVDVSRLVSRVAPIAQWSSLSRVLLHLTIPGTPDIYQGDELWNFTLVDPDNRRPVDYDARRSTLGAVMDTEIHHPEGLKMTDTSPKMLVTHRILAARKTQEKLFTSGDYVPLRVSGSRARNVVAFSRSLDGEHAVVIAPRLVGDVIDKPVAERWTDTVVELPDQIGSLSLKCAVTGRRAVIRDNKLIVGEATPDMAFGLFVN